MNKPFWWFSLVFVIVGGGLLGHMLTPVVTLEIYDETGTSRRLCYLIHPAENVVYLSINSIYGVPVAEEWRVSGERIQVSRVVSMPVVLDYYGIPEYQVGADGQASGEPGLSYDRLRIRLTAQGQQRLRFGEQEIVLWDVAPEGALMIQLRSLSRWLACR